MLLVNKTSVVYGADDPIGGAVAKALALEGVRLFLVGLKPPELETVAQDIREAGGQAETAVVDMLDEAAVTDHANAVAAIAGSVDVCVIACSGDDICGPGIHVPVRDFERSVGMRITAHLIVTKAVARHMITQGSGVILHLEEAATTNARQHQGAIEVAASAVEAVRHQLACELSGHGIHLVHSASAASLNRPTSDA